MDGRGNEVELLTKDIFAPAIQKALLSPEEMEMTRSMMRYYKGDFFFETEKLDTRKIYAKLVVEKNECYIAILMSSEVSDFINQELMISLSNDSIYFMESCCDLLIQGFVMLDSFKEENPELFLNGPIFQSGMNGFMPSLDIIPSGFSQYRNPSFQEKVVS